MTNSIVQIPFHSTSINAVMHDGKPFVSIRHMCDSLGIDTESQRKKLNGKSWATAVIIPAVGLDGKNRDLHMIDRRTMTMWLATIDTNRVKEESRELLIKFQNEAADVLDQHFNGNSAPLTEEQIVHQALQITAAKVQALEAKVEADAPKVDYVDTHVADNDYHLFRAVASNLNVKESELRWALVYTGWIYHDQMKRRNSKGEIVTEHQWSEFADKKRYFHRSMNHQAPLFRGNVAYTLKLTTEGVAAVTRHVHRIEAEFGNIKSAIPTLEARYNEKKAA